MVIGATLIFAILYFSGLLSSKVSFGFNAINTTAEWRASFKYLNGQINGKVHPTSDHTIILITSDLDKGSIEFYVYQNNELIEKIKSKNHLVDTIRNLNINSTYRIQARAKSAKGSFLIKVK